MRKLLLFVAICIANNCLAQNRYWADPLGVPNGIEPTVCSELLQMCSYDFTSSQLEKVKQRTIVFPVKKMVPLGGMPDKELLGFALEQIGAEHLIDAGLTGKGVKVGIIDGGFLKANERRPLASVFAENRVADYTDWITPDLAPYEGSVPLDDLHGTDVWQLIAGFDKTKNLRLGIATDAIYYLARTDHGGYEKRLEEDLLIEAMESMIAKGVRLINVSLGYTNGYNRKEENYQPEDMDGKTSMVARAVDSAFFNHDVLVVCAAGNDGNAKWKVVNTPGDASGAFTVGAVKMNIYERMDYSSVGSPFLTHMKPNVSCFATQGTSFATPIITGLAASIWQYDSTFTASDVRSIIERSSNYYPYGNDHVGYGVPNGERVMQMLRTGEVGENMSLEVRVQKNTFKLDRTLKVPYVVVYHKRNDFQVVSTEILRPEASRIKLKRLEGIVRTTLLIDNEIIEIFWD
ncbi:MAG: S8 family serine peptidase [Cyclobacteriaceae bacterium]